MRKLQVSHGLKTAVVDCKAIADGEADNVWTETYNDKPVKSNTVTTTTPTPKKPAIPAKPAPAKATSAPAYRH